MHESTAIKDGLRDSCSCIPKSVASREQPAENHRHAASIRSQGEAREAVRNRQNPTFAACGCEWMAPRPRDRATAKEHFEAPPEPAPALRLVAPATVPAASAWWKQLVRAGLPA